MRAVRRAGGRLGAVHDSSNIIHRSSRYCGAHCVAGRLLFLTSERGRMRVCLGPHFSRRKALERSGCSVSISVLAGYCALSRGVRGRVVVTFQGRLSSSLYNVCLYLTTPLATENILAELSTGIGRDSSVGIATHYGLDGPGIESRWGRDFLHPSRPALGHTLPPIQWVPGISLG
jgi:hypothetical protein